MQPVAAARTRWTPVVTVAVVAALATAVVGPHAVASGEPDPRAQGATVVDAPDPGALAVTTASGHGKLADGDTPPAAEVYEGNFPDPSVVPVPGGYLAFGTQTGRHLVPALWSPDLGRWSGMGDVLPELPAWAQRRDLWAPGVAFMDGLWTLFYTAPDVTTGLPCIGVASGARAEGPYTDWMHRPLVCQPELRGSIDPFPFVDADGQAYLLWKSEGFPGGERTKIWAAPLRRLGVELAGPPTLILQTAQAWEEPLIENPAMLRWGDLYYLFYSSGDWSTAGYTIGYAVCQGPLGPCGRPIDRPLVSSTGDVAGPGGASPFVGHDGQPYLAFHAWHPTAVGYPEGNRSLHVARLHLDGYRVGVEGFAPPPDVPTTGPLPNPQPAARFDNLTGARWGGPMTIVAGGFRPGAEVRASAQWPRVPIAEPVVADERGIATLAATMPESMEHEGPWVYVAGLADGTGDRTDLGALSVQVLQLIVHG